MTTRALPGRSSALALDDAYRLLARADWSAPGGPVVLPYASVDHGNPYQSLVYSRFREMGVLPLPAHDVGTAVRLASELRGSARVVVHLHWLNRVLAGAADDVEAAGRVDELRASLATLHEHGARLLWTVHNVLPHRAERPELEAAVLQAVADASDVVHVMNAGTVEACAPYYAIDPDRAVVVPHPAYDEAYPAAPDRGTARAALGIGEGTTVLLLFGRLLAYKGLTELREAFTSLSLERPGACVLVVAGRAVDGDVEAEEFLAWAEAHPSVHVLPGRVAPEDVPVVVSAADVSVLPYRRSLNSGALALSATFGVPVVVPDGMAEVDPSWSRTYDPSAADGLLDALRRACDDLVTPDARRAAREAADRAPAATVSHDLGRAVLRLAAPREELP